jgi:hypothetical protein
MHRHATAAGTLAATAVLLASCSNSSSHNAKPTGTVTTAAAMTTTPSTTPATGHYASAQAVADALKAAGFTVSALKPDDAATNEDMGMDSAYDLTITNKPGPAAGTSGINTFRNHEALTSWVELSKSFGGIAVTGDTWAVSLTTDGPVAVASSKTLAPKIAKALGGTVQE